MFRWYAINKVYFLKANFVELACYKVPIKLSNTTSSCFFGYVFLGTHMNPVIIPYKAVKYTILLPYMVKLPGYCPTTIRERGIFQKLWKIYYLS